MDNKHNGSRVREWLNRDLKTHGFKEGVEKARALGGHFEGRIVFGKSQ